ncbi:MAG: 23S rRNA (pseudouridine(1915)-N(3))-methyltransferase RlmH [Clostridia bacterium]|nr:23S rRNA (pseudouridine(1915)-N(3))-methyltransferase RlmH [Clostridia bacterium]
MLRIKIIAMGRLTEKPYIEMASEFAKRISKSYRLEIAEPKPVKLSDKPSPAEISNALAKEAEFIKEEIPARSHVIAMCVEGKTMSSEKLSSYLSDVSVSGTGQICFIIGSSYGLDESIKSASDLKLSVSPMTFPHELFRIMLLEQIYRAGEIASGGRYHK